MTTMTDKSPSREQNSRVWPPPAADDEGYPISIADYLDDTELIDNFNRLQLRIKDHLSAMRSGLNVPLPPTVENKKAAAAGKLAVRTQLQEKLTKVKSSSSSSSTSSKPLPMYVLIGMGDRPEDIPEGGDDSELEACNNNNNPATKKFSPSPKKSPASTAKSRIQGLTNAVMQQDKDEQEVVVAAAPKASSSTSSGCESAGDQTYDLPAPGDPVECQPVMLPPAWCCSDQLSTLTRSLSAQSITTPLVYNGRVLHSETQLKALLNAFYQAGVMMGRVHALQQQQQHQRVVSHPGVDDRGSVSRQTTSSTEMPASSSSSGEVVAPHPTPASSTQLQQQAKRKKAGNGKKK